LSFKRWASQILFNVAPYGVLRKCNVWADVLGEGYGVSSSFLGIAKPCPSPNRRAILLRNEESVQTFLRLLVNLRSALSEGVPRCIPLAASK
jgi:hypothetical protein